MGYNRENYMRIRAEYEGKNLRAKEAAKNRAEALYPSHPELKRIDLMLSQTGMSIFREATKGTAGLDERIAALRETNATLLEARGAYLESIGYPKDYTSVKYDCDKCSDTGFVGLKMCDCMKKALVTAGYESSGLSKLIMTQSFETFKADYYNDKPEEKSIMMQNVENCKEFANRFSENNGESMLFIGGPGLGKTHLSTAVAKVVIERGFDVVYDTAQNILADFEYERFSRGYSDTSEPKTAKYFDCDLLIIDDLGTEISNQFTTACIYNIINTRMNKSKSMLISTNLNNKGILERYGERVVSRLFGEFMAYRFVGKDVRLQRAMGK